jgi:hypothetical protein
MERISIGAILNPMLLRILAVNFIYLFIYLDGYTFPLQCLEQKRPLPFQRAKIYKKNALNECVKV